MHTTAIYRLLYGSDFICESLASIYDACDQILCFVGHEPFGGQQVVRYFGRDVYIPYDIDGLTDAIHAWKREHDLEGKVRILANPYATLLKGQLQRMVNDVVLPQFPRTTHVFFVECDEVWHEKTIREFFQIVREDDKADEFLAEPHLFWKTYRHASTRTNPYAVMRALKGANQIGLTGHALMGVDDTLVRRATGLRVHNFGFAASERTIFWKHLTALSFSRDLQLDNPPREGWFEEVWRPWHWATNPRTDLCPSEGYEHVFPPAKPYPIDQLPCVMRERIERAPLREWDEVNPWAPALGLAAREERCA